MKSYHVIMPVEGYLEINERFDSVFNYLDRLDATVHLVTRCKTLPRVHQPSEELTRQQEQIAKMAGYLKFETLDKMAQGIQERFARINFKLHVSSDALPHSVANLHQEFDAQFLIIDQPYLHEDDNKAKLELDANGEIKNLVAVTDLPIWCVGPNTSTEGDTLVALDLPAHNNQLDQLNRSLIETGILFAKNFHSELQVTHSWQLSSEQFMRQWLKLTDIDIARFSRTEKQQRESRILEYLNDANCRSIAVHIQVIEGAANVSLPNVCQAREPQLLVLGYNQNAYGPIGHVTHEVMQSVSCDTLVLPQTIYRHQVFKAIEPLHTHPQAKRLS